MDIKEIKILGKEADEHWYYQSKARFLLAMIGSNKITKIYDVGAGSGFFSRWLLNHTDAREAICVDIGYQRDSDIDIGNKVMRFRKKMEIQEADLVLFMDVLEHVEDDVNFVKSYVDRFSENTTFVFTVPAFSFLWSSHDVYLQHKRRYTLGSLVAVLKKSGLQIVRANYCFALIFPIVLLIRLTENFFMRRRGEVTSLRKHSVPVNVILNFLCWLELSFERFNKTAGVSIICKCKKLV